MECKIGGCGRPVSHIGYCRTHYRRSRLGMDMFKPIASSHKGSVCSVPRCDREALIRGWCKTCDGRWRRGIGPVGPLRVSHSCVDLQGYIRWNISHPENTFGRQIKEHHAVMIRHLGRNLLPDENVHHKNGDRTDNRLENLELWNVSQPPGQRIEDKVQWAKEILVRYGDFSS